MISRIGPLELALALGVALMVFGPKKLPEVGKAIGRGLREFRDATKEISQTVQDVEEEKA